MSFDCLIGVARTFKTMLNKSGGSGNPCLTPDFRGKAFFQLFSIEYYNFCGFIINGFYYIKVCSFYNHFGKSFYHEWMLDFSNAFSTSIEMIMCFLTFPYKNYSN